MDSERIRRSQNYQNTKEEGMMSLQKKIAKVTEEQFGIELTDEEIGKVSGGSKEIDMCRFDVYLESYTNWTDGGKCNDCHLYYKLSENDLGYNNHCVAKFMCRELGVREKLSITGNTR